jgi:molybdopterin converting factor small subunit
MIEVRFFGQLTDRTGSASIQLEDPVDTETLIQLLHEKFPALTGMKYMVAVDNKIVNTNTVLAPGCRVDLLPPFSGG